MLQQVRISIGRTWALRTQADDQATVTADKTGYRNIFNQLKAGSADPAGFTMPWPPYKSTFWQAMFSGPYLDISDFNLVAALVPTLLVQEPELPEPIPGTQGGVRVEIWRHPYALTSITHLALHDEEMAAGHEAEALDHLLRQALDPAHGSQVRDGTDATAVVGATPDDADNRPAHFTEHGRFMLLSGLHAEASDPKALAASLAELFQNEGSGQPMNSAGSGVALAGDTMGIVLPRNTVRAGGKLDCLHHNQSTLLALMQNHIAGIAGSPTVAAGWYQRQAAMILNGLYRRATVTGLPGIYRSRVAEMWITHRQVRSAINALNAQEPKVPPPLPAD
jgi:hypothetical protein